MAFTATGDFRFGRRLVHIANALTNPRIGIAQPDDGYWLIDVHTFLLAALDERDCITQS